MLTFRGSLSYVWGLVMLTFKGYGGLLMLKFRS